VAVGFRWPFPARWRSCWRWSDTTSPHLTGQHLFLLFLKIKCQTIAQQ
jgi:hypothetical protein